MLDLANLKLMPLPYVIQDIQMLLYIEKKILDEIIRAYKAKNQLGK